MPCLAAERLLNYKHSGFHSLEKIIAGSRRDGRGGRKVKVGDVFSQSLQPTTGDVTILCLTYCLVWTFVPPVSLFACLFVFAGVQKIE